MKPSYLLLILILYFALCIFLLPIIPIAWIDEVMFADAAKNLAQTGNYSSRLWEQPHTEQFLLGHLPLWQLSLALWYTVFPTDIFWTRVPGILLYMGLALLVWNYYKNQLNPSIAAILTLACIGDKALFEAARSVRMDMLGAVLFFSIATGDRLVWNVYLRSFLCGLLALVHPNFWFAASLMGISLFWENKKKWNLFIPALIPILLYLSWIFPWRHLITEQLVSNGGDHIEVSGNLLSKLSDYFYLRYFKWYEIQQTLPILYLFTLAAGIVLFPGVKETRKWTILLIGQTLFLAFVTGDFPRYNLPIVVCVWIMLPWVLVKIPGLSGGKKIPQFLQIGMVLLALYPISSRAIISLYQQEEREPKEVIKWIAETIPQEQKTLLVDEAIGYYLQREQTDFALIHTKDKFNYNQYPGGVYWLTYESEVDSNLKFISKYPIESKQLPNWIPMRQTYRGLILYQVMGQAAYDELR
jgi:hypothetical protein